MDLITFIAELDQLCETAEADGLDRKDVICELEAKLADLRADRENDWPNGPAEKPVAFMPLP